MKKDCRVLGHGIAFAAVVSFATAAWAAPAACNVHAYGAKGDGVTKDTAAIQAAIDDCAKQGGGVVQLTAGTYLSAPIVLRSNITFQLDKGATLLGSPEHSDYAAKIEFKMPDRQPLVGAENASNIAITGDGVIDGNGESWWREARAVKDHGILGTNPRPKLIILDHCRHVRVEGITIQNSPMWQLVPYYTDDVVIRNVKVLAPSNSPNTDAVDPFSSSNIVIDHVLADVGDDDVAIKSGPIDSPGPDDPSRNITITNCIFRHGHGLSIGSEISGGVHNVHVDHVRFEGTDNGIRIKSNRDRGNDVGNFVFRNIEMKDVKNAIVISEYYPKMLPAEGEGAAAPMTRLTPNFHDIVLENVQAEGGENAGVIIGLPESPVENVVLHNVHVSAQKPMIIGYAEVAGNDFKVTVPQGEGITQKAGARVTLK
jgi:polygalacturonase